MNKLTIIGNLTREPELRTTSAGINVCSFTVAVNRRKRPGEEQEADFFNVSAWRERGELCAKYLSKGRKVCVIGPVSVRTYQANDGSTRAQLEVTADEVEFLSSASSSGNENKQPAQEVKRDPQTGFEQIELDELPF